ncbi:hypothetical protein NEOLEDRAFT_1142339 [Neolentinus lepideus HHB14362 ss-1]|uniref:Uncharacterized protein n=1 Tax=Neolentinus lepideus HHB14362 ss-1 TaxID=1314782 RepID=A0A165N6C1_9AGAM|nr:hypothetical protein NEOLEDRAFT_1142339 [Neolentinus lepideus HHB14362 ss-1]
MFSVKPKSQLIVYWACALTITQQKAGQESSSVTDSFGDKPFVPSGITGQHSSPDSGLRAPVQVEITADSDWLRRSVEIRLKRSDRGAVKTPAKQFQVMIKGGSRHIRYEFQDLRYHARDV